MYVCAYVCISVCCICIHCNTCPYLHMNVHTRLFRLRCCSVVWPKCVTAFVSGWSWAPSTSMPWWSSTASSWRTGRPTSEHSRRVGGRWRSCQSMKITSVLSYEVLSPGSMCTLCIRTCEQYYTYVHMYVRTCLQKVQNVHVCIYKCTYVCVCT